MVRPLGVPAHPWNSTVDRRVPRDTRKLKNLMLGKWSNNACRGPRGNTPRSVNGVGRGVSNNVVGILSMNKRDKMNASYAVADALLGKHTGASKGSKPPPKPKVKPVIGKDKIGFKVTRKF